LYSLKTTGIKNKTLFRMKILCFFLLSLIWKKQGFAAKASATHILPSGNHPTMKPGS
jgi:hypothetical protein